MARTPSNRFCSRIIAASLFANNQGSATTIAAWRALMERVAAAVRLLPLSPLETGPNPLVVSRTPTAPPIRRDIRPTIVIYRDGDSLEYNPTIAIFRDGDSLVYINGRVDGSKLVWSNGTILSATQGGCGHADKLWCRVWSSSVVVGISLMSVLQSRVESGVPFVIGQAKARNCADSIN
jgi:hypothetical protein